MSVNARIEQKRLRMGLLAARMGLDADSARALPPISDIIKVAKGGVKTIVAALRFIADPDIDKFFDVFDELTPQEQKEIPFEWVAAKADIDPSRLLGKITLALRAYSVNMVKIIATSHHADVMKARVGNAKEPRGVRDRNALDQALGFMPRPKGATTIINVPGGTSIGDDDGDVIEAGDIDADDLFPSLSSTQKLLTE
jgi:hypothetical protein